MGGDLDGRPGIPCPAENPAQLPARRGPPRIVRHTGTVRLDRLRPSAVEALDAAVAAEGCSAGTLAHLRRTLNAALAAAVRDGHLLPPHPAQRARLPRLPPSPKIVPLSSEEARRVLAAAHRTRQPARWSVALSLGLRQGEVLGLCWDDIDLDAGTLTVRHQLSWRAWKHGCPADVDGRPTCTYKGKAAKPGPAAGGRCPQRIGGGPVLAEPKSAAGRRLVHLPGPLADQLRAHRAAQAGERLAWGSRWDPDRHGWGLVFPAEAGRAQRPESDSRAWHRLLDVAAVPQQRLHDARHTAATLLLVQGVDTTTVGALLGHTSPTVTRRYQHVVDELRAAAAAKMGELLWGAGPSREELGRP